MTASLAFEWVTRLIGLTVMLQSIELLQLRRVWRAGGRFDWQLVGQEFSTAPRWVRAALGVLLGESGFGPLLTTRLLVAAYTLGTGATGGLSVLLLTTALIAIRWRGTFNGASDSMTLLILLALTVSAALPEVELLRLAALLHIAIQTLLSYFIGGLVKVRGPRWRSGAVLNDFLSSSRYSVPPLATKLSRRSGLMRAAAWFLMAFELAAPLTLSSPTLCIGYLSAAFGFHLLNVWLFGLNRFFWAWISAFPAVYFASTLFG